MKNLEIIPDKIRMKRYDDITQYKINMAKKLLLSAMNELKNYLPTQWREIIIPKLDESLAICDMIHITDDELEQRQLTKSRIESRR